MQTECRNEKLEFQACGARQVVAEFNGGTITSDGGVLLLKEVEAKSSNDHFARAPFFLAAFIAFLASRCQVTETPSGSVFSTFAYDNFVFAYPLARRAGLFL